jgi:hypothetical protein
MPPIPGFSGWVDADIDPRARQVRARGTKAWARDRLARAGAPFELIARQLGPRDVAMVAKVYGYFKADTEERDRCERIAATRDAEKWENLGAQGGAGREEAPENLREQTPVSDDAHEGCDDSRGGTRTRDPGVMSSGDSLGDCGSPSDEAP